MAQRFDTENQQEDAIDPALPYDWFFHNPPEGQCILKLSTARPSSGEANGGGHGHSLTSIEGGRLDTLHPSSYSVNPAVLHQQPFHLRSVAGPSQLRYLGGPVTVPANRYQGPPQAGSFAAEAKGNSITETSRNPYSSRSNLPPLAPWPSHIVRPLSSSQRRSHASGSAVDRSDPHHASHFSSSVSGHHNATSVVEQPQRRRGRHASQRFSPSSISAPATSASSRFHPYAASGASTQARHGQSSLTSLSSPELVGLQPTPSQNGHLKLSFQEHASRSELLRKEVWFKNQTEEPRVTEADRFVEREYISAADKTRFSAFVWIDPRARRVVCRIPHKITIKGNSVPCTYERENIKEAVAHVSESFGYFGYKCQSAAPGHRCDKRFPTRERRNDHYSKVMRGPDPSSTCNECNKRVMERNMERHTRKCKGKTETESQPER